MQQPIHRLYKQTEWVNFRKKTLGLSALSAPTEGSQLHAQNVDFRDATIRFADKTVLTPTEGPIRFLQFGQKLKHGNVKYKSKNTKVQIQNVRRDTSKLEVDLRA